jgi:ABC-2 type transport system permease protein
MKNNMKRGEPEEKRSSLSKKGFVTAALSAVVLAAVIVLNLLLSTLPSGTLEFDISEKSYYKVSKPSVDYLNALDKDVQIVVLAQADVIDEMLLKVINNYANISPRVKLEVIDPVLNPTVLTAYGAQANNVVVTCPDTGKTRLLNLAGIDGESEGLLIYDAASFYYYNQLNPIYLDAEGQLTGAINYVTGEETHKMYLLEGHGEAALGKNAASLLSKSSIETATLNLLAEGGIPDDCELLLCYNPERDLAGDELELLKTYLRTGGNVMLILGNPELTNFGDLLLTYGLQLQNGVVADTAQYYKAYADTYGYFCIYPTLALDSEITAGIEYRALLRFAGGMLAVTPERRAAVVTPFMTTSDKGLLAVDETNMTEGQFILGATAVESFPDKEDTEARLTVISAPDLLSDDLTAYASISNFDIFMNAVSANLSGVKNLTVSARSLNITMNTVANPGVWSLIFIGIIPEAVLAVGLVYWSRRRRR